jgi:two-component system, OmpR family, KDP operon response regulator KdpE
MTQVLLIEDDSHIRRLLRISLEKQGFHVHESARGDDGIQRFAGVKPDVVLLDLGLPDQDGIEVLRTLRANSQVPVIVLSVRNTEGDIVELLNAGADDYLVKPFNTAELVARMKVALRHSFPPELGSPLELGKLRIDLRSRSVTMDGREVRLTPTEYSILRCLASHAGRIVTHEQIIGEVWGAQAGQDSNNLRVYINQLRKKLEREPSRPEALVTEPGIGYRMKI